MSSLLGVLGTYSKTVSWLDCSLPTGTHDCTVSSKNGYDPSNMKSLFGHKFGVWCTNVCARVFHRLTKLVIIVSCCTGKAVAINTMDYVHLSYLNQSDKETLPFNDRYLLDSKLPTVVCCLLFVGISFIGVTRNSRTGSSSDVQVDALLSTLFLVCLLLSYGDAT